MCVYIYIYIHTHIHTAPARQLDGTGVEGPGLRAHNEIKSSKIKNKTPTNQQTMDFSSNSNMFIIQ